MGKIKQQRIAEQIRELMSQMILFDLNDPRVQGLTITSVTLDRELQHADIRVNALADEERESEVLSGLQSASSYLRRELGKRLRLRRMPQLHFHWDYTLQHVMQVNSILDGLEIPAEEIEQETVANETESDDGVQTV